MTVADEHFMREALAEADKAMAAGEVPVGAVVVFGGKIVGRGRNDVIRTSDPTAHAEICAIREAGQGLGNYRLPGAIIYSTIEPCPMCAGAMINEPIGRLGYGAE